MTINCSHEARMEVGPAAKRSHNAYPQAAIPLATPPRHGNRKRTTPSPTKSPRQSPTSGDRFSGARFSEPPTPSVLPRPPTSWTGHKTTVATPPVDAISDQLKFLLKVHGWGLGSPLSSPALSLFYKWTDGLTNFIERFLSLLYFTD